MKVLVTGAAGFIGRHVVNWLTLDGYEVHTWTRGALPKEKVFDAVVHCAATSPQKNVTQRQVINDGIWFTHCMLDLCRFKKIIFCSSMAVYGTITDNEIGVDAAHDIINPDVYGASKFICEQMLKETGIPTLALRLPGVVGYGAARCWLADVGAKLKAEEPVKIYNEDEMFNNVIHVVDLAAFIEQTLEQEWDGFHALPIGAADVMSIKQVVQTLGDYMDVDPQFVVFKKAKKKSFTINSDELIDRWDYEPATIDSILHIYANDLNDELPR